jgi:hypothetical protein
MKASTQPVQGLVRKNPISLKLGFSGNDYGYAIDLGLPLPDSRSKFSSDPEIKVESQWTGERLGRANEFAVRNGPLVRIRNDSGEWRQAYQHLASLDSMMTHCSDPRDGIEALRIIGWHPALSSARRRAALAAAAGLDDSERTRNEPASGFVATAGAPDRASLEAVSGCGGFPCRGTGFRARRPLGLQANRSGEATRRNRHQGRHGAGLDMAFAIILSEAINGSSSRRGLRAGRWRFRLRTSSRPPRGAYEWHRCGLSRRRD